MNNELRGLFQETPEQKKKWKQRRTYWTTNARAYKINGNFAYDLVDGSAAKMFLHKNNAYHLVNIVGFADGTYQIENDKAITSKNITKMIERKQLVCAPPLGVPVHFNNLGVIEISEVLWGAEPSEKLKEILDLPNQFGSGQTVHERCVALYNQYLRYPDEKTRALLREAYEAVPEHERMYLGDMDSKDYDYRRILFEPNNKREV
jgi:hypothetical protein